MRGLENLPRTLKRKTLQRQRGACILHGKEVKQPRLNQHLTVLHTNKYVCVFMVHSTNTQEEAVQHSV